MNCSIQSSLSATLLNPEVDFQISPKLKNFLPIILIEIELVVDNLSSRDVGGVGCGGTEIMNPINN